MILDVEWNDLALLPWGDLVNHKRAIISTACLLSLSLSSVWLFKNSHLSKGRNLTDEALLALIKNDLSSFESFIKAGGNIHEYLPEIDGQKITVAQGLAYFERLEFAKYLHQKKMTFVEQNQMAKFDIMTLVITKNNPDLLNQLSLENPQFNMPYGKKGWSLLHLASAVCSHKLIGILQEKGQLRWDLKAKDGSTPLTLAAENDCLPMLSFWKEQNADFKFKDGRGHSGLSILKKKKNAALVAFADSFETRMPSSLVLAKTEPDFYKKRKIPKDQLIDHAALIEPEDRPLGAIETAETSEFAD